MQVTLYKFAKRANSTKVPPSGTPSLPLASVKINDGNTSIINPSIRLPDTVSATLSDFNYCYIPKFTRYYYIQNWTYNGDGTWTADCSIDMLASWRSEIFSSSGYVSRSSLSSEWSKFVPDSFYPATLQSISCIDEFNTGFDSRLAYGTFIVGIIANDTYSVGTNPNQGPNVGAVTYYALHLNELKTLINNMITTSTSAWSSVDSFTSDAVKSVLNPIQFIVSCMWFPFGFQPPVSVPATNIYLWGWDTGATGKKINDTWLNFPLGEGAQWNTAYIIDIDDESFPGHSTLTDEYACWPPYAPYATYSMITPWGTFDLDTQIIANRFMAKQIGVETAANRKVAIEYRIQVNLISGTGTLEVRTPPKDVPETNHILFKRNISVGLEIPLVQLSIQYLDAAKTTASALTQTTGAVGSAVMNGSGAIGAAVQGAATLITNMIDVVPQLFAPSVQSTSSTNAAFTPLIEKVYIQSTRYRTINQRPALFGKPVKKYYNSLSTFAPTQLVNSVFVQMDQTDFNALCTTTEHDAIIEQLLGGVFFE